MNKFFGIGRLTKDPELRYLANNTPIAEFSIAINRNFTNAQGQKETDYINIVVWRNQAENVKKYCSKGSLVAVTGRIQTRNYDGQDGKKIYVTEVVADNIQFLDNKSSNGQTPQNEDIPRYTMSMGFVNSEDCKRANEELRSKQDQPFADFGNQIELDPREFGEEDAF